jgi:hypothetical protein
MEQYATKDNLARRMQTMSNQELSDMLLEPADWTTEALDSAREEMNMRHLQEASQPTALIPDDPSENAARSAVDSGALWVPADTAARWTRGFLQAGAAVRRKGHRVYPTRDTIAMAGEGAHFLPGSYLHELDRIVNASKR